MKLDRARLIRAREILGYGLEKTAEEAGVSKNSVLRAEHEEDIRPGTARKIAAALGVTVADLLEEAHPKAEAPSSPGLPREESIFDLVHDAILEDDKRSRQAAARAKESTRPQTRFMRFEDEALVRLLERYPDEVADSYIDLMRSYVQLEAEKAKLEERLRTEKAGIESV